MPRRCVQAGCTRDFPSGEHLFYCAIHRTAPGSASTATNKWDKLRLSGAIPMENVGLASLETLVPVLGAALTTLNRESLRSMFNAAAALELPRAPAKGAVCIHIKEGTFAPTTHAFQPGRSLVNKGDTPPAGGKCAENLLITSDPGDNLDMIVRSSKAPCNQCTSGYRGWAMSLKRHVVVHYDEPYDTFAAANGYLYFTPDGKVFYVKRP